MPGVDRRTVIKGAAAAAATAPFSWALSRSAAAAPSAGGDTELHWLEGAAPGTHAGTVWGVPWSRGTYQPDQTFRPATGNPHHNTQSANNGDRHCGDQRAS